jgi:hypothetical protein
MPEFRNGARAHALAPFLLAFAAIPGTADDLPMAVAVEGTQIVARGGDGTALAPQALIGATFALADPAAGVYLLRIDGVMADPDAPRELDLYDLSVRAPASERWDKLCEPDPYGHTAALVVPGSWDAEGRFVSGAPGDFSLACTAGARGKCVRFGYLPWASAPNGESMAGHHAACVRMVRADYCGDGTPHTVPGVTIQIFDRAGVHGLSDAAFGAFEAVWGPDGAACLARTRRPEFPLADILRQCPRLARVLPAACTEAAIDTLPGALLGNRS